MTVTVAAVSISSVSNPPAVAGVALSLAVDLLSKLGPQVPGSVAGAIGASSSAGAILGAVLSRTAAGALTGAVSGGAGSAILSTGPIGWVVLGSSRDEEGKRVTFDCWKQVLRDLSDEESKGMLIRDVVLDSRIKDVAVTPKPDSMPEVILENVWNEKFRLEFFALEESELVAHAIPCC